MDTEIWKPVVGYEGIYEVSNLGNIKSIKRGLMTKRIFDKDGYVSVRLSKNGIKKAKILHRLVLGSFIKNTENKRTVNHNNGIKHDNRLENLEWATDKENTQHYYEFLRKK